MEIDPIIRKKILDKSEFSIKSESTFSPRIVMKCFGIEMTSSISCEMIQDLKWYGFNNTKELLEESIVNEFIKNHYDLYIQQDRDEKLNKLLND